MSQMQTTELKSYEMILASAGSGKTYRLTTRMIALMALGLEPKGFSALTFTKKAAGEFREQWLKKLAEGSLEPKHTQQLSTEIARELSQEQLLEWLEQALAQLPKMFLGTLDAFCFKVLSMMQHELGMVGQLQMADENETDIIAQEVLQQVLSDESRVAADFMAIITELLQGKEAFNINGQVQMIIKETLSLWEKVRGTGDFCDAVIELSERYQPYILSDEAYQEQCEILDQQFPEFLTKAGKVNANAAKFQIKFSEMMLGQQYKDVLKDTLGLQFLEVLRGERTDLSYSRTAAECSPAFIHALRLCLQHGAAQELKKQEQRLRALSVFLQRYYQIYQRWFIEQGKLSFDLVRHLLHDWLYQQEDAILAQKMEWLKFRLDASYQHWFLDEFQDTSGQDLEMLSPFLEEALLNEDCSVLVVGDKKQSIYGFRGGDYRLFNQLQDDYPQFEQEQMAESWRSTPPVLELVNHLFGDSTLLQDYWGQEITHQWEWQDHISAKPLQDKAGRAAVLQLNPHDDASKEDTKALLHQSLIKLIHEQPQLHWGVLCRNNKQVAEVVAALRAEQMNVVENGRDTPITKHPLGVLTIELLHWLEFPQDKRAWSYLLMSPLKAYWQSLLSKNSEVIELSTLGSSSIQVWKKLHQQVRIEGFVEVWHQVMQELEKASGGLSVSADHCSHIIEQQLHGLEPELKQGAYASVASKLASFSQKVIRGEGLVEVMTVHASKGLTFDASIYAIEDTTKFPDKKKLKYLELSDGHNQSAGGYWLGNPQPWLESVIPELSVALQAWQDKEAYAEICTTYVALTRARECSYLILPAMKDESKIALSYWLAEAFTPTKEPKIVHQGDCGELLSLWLSEQGKFSQKTTSELVATSDTQLQTSSIKLNQAQPLLRKKTPSEHSSSELEPNFIQRRKISQQAMDKGSDVHAAFESVTWVNQTQQAKLNMTDISELAGQIVETCLADPLIRNILSHEHGLTAGQSKSYYQEQAFDVILKEEDEPLWLSGIIDRLHLIKNSQGQVVSAEIIDFKTDKVLDAQMLIDRHHSQLLDYAQAIAEIYTLPLSEINCYLVSTHLTSLIKVH